MPCGAKGHEGKESPEGDLACRGAGGRGAATMPASVVGEGCATEAVFEQRPGGGRGTFWPSAGRAFG